ncbi:orotate phosphoribosyltransferase [Cytophagaceae bacterium ABcell3]|nr:orotate phosphoribosyltransferase [Cytophagaceae bacterium ABcell3]
MNTARKTAASLLQIKAIKLSPDKPFTWASGWNSPIYCDNRLSLSYPEIRTLIKDGLAEAVKESFPQVEAIAGVATAGIAQGALVADVLDLPFLYVRPKPKDHGMGNQIEGAVSEGQKVVLIEDLVSTGGSSLKAADALKRAGFEVLGMVAIFTYGFKVADDNFKNAGIKLVTLSDYNTLIEEAVSGNYISESDLNSLKEWRNSPDTWKK